MYVYLPEEIIGSRFEEISLEKRLDEWEEERDWKSTGRRVGINREVKIEGNEVEVECELEIFLGELEKWFEGMEHVNYGVVFTHWELKRRRRGERHVSYGYVREIGRAVTEWSIEIRKNERSLHRLGGVAEYLSRAIYGGKEKWWLYGEEMERGWDIEVILNSGWEDFYKSHSNSLEAAKIVLGLERAGVIKLDRKSRENLRFGANV